MENGKPHIWLEEGGEETSSFDPYGQCSKKEERNAKRKEKMRRNAKRKEKMRRNEREQGREMRRRNDEKKR